MELIAKAHHATYLLRVSREAIDQSNKRLTSWNAGQENWLTLYHTLVQKASDNLQASRDRSLFNRRPFIEV